MKTRNICFSLWQTFFVVFATILIHGCQEEPQVWDKKSTDLVISDYVANNPELSEINKILESTGLNSLLSVRGPYTVFLPIDDAMQAYYAEKGVDSFDDFSPEVLKRFIYNLLVPATLETGTFGLGSLNNKNALSDFLVTEFDGADVIINKYSRIIKRNIPSANGVIHLIDKAIDPITKSVYDVLSENSSYSIFTKGLELTGLKDTLDIIDFPFGTKTARTRYTILAVADSTYNRFEIFSAEDLVARFTDAPDSITHFQNGFYRYMEYHCLGETYYLNNLTSKNYPILSYDNNISATIDTDYKLNYDPKTRKYTGFYIGQSNIPAKNGAIHTVNSLLPVFVPKPTTLIWETTDHFDLKQGDYYGNYYGRWFDGENTFKNIKWDADYLLYYLNRGSGTLNNDCLSMSGWWWCEVTTPKIMKGKYKITSILWDGQVNYAVYVDGVQTAQIKMSDKSGTTSWGEFDWKKTSTHKIRVRAMSPGLLFWDTITFTPIQD